MSKHIVPLIPKHRIYTEAFFGGGAIFFNKEAVEMEVINDLNGEVVNFYKILTTDFWKLNEMVQSTLLSRELYENAMVVYNYPKLFDPIRRAWAFWILTNQGYVSKIGSWGYDADGSTMVKKLSGKKLEFGVEIRTRLERAQIECNDAIKVISSRDHRDAFHYVDPPYIGSNLGHYAGYTDADYKGLLKLLSGIKGKFLLSNYRSDLLSASIERYGWSALYFDKQLSASPDKSKRKVEVLCANYDLKDFLPNFSG